ncbi:MAG: type II toxin-antitoxin system Phd/YefM family antitoxin [Verrucomicrobiales bacterium]
MRTTSIRELQHGMAKVLAWVEEGEQVQIRRRHKVIARIIPDREEHRQAPDFARRFGAVPKRAAGKKIPAAVMQDILDYARSGHFDDLRG